MEYLGGLMPSADSVAAVFGWIILSLAVLSGTLLNMVGLFGNWVILGGLAALWLLTGLGHFGWVGFLAFIGIAVLGEILETVLAGYGARKFGGSKGSMFAALVGCILGAIFGTPLFPVVGTLIGAMLGAFAGAALYEYLQQEKSTREAAWTGVGAALGKLGGVFAKLACGFAMLIAAWFTW